MTTVINTPPAGDNGDSGAGIILGVIVAIVIIVLFFVYGLPAIRGANNTEPRTTNINVQIPTSEMPSQPAAEAPLMPASTDTTTETSTSTTTQ